MHFHGMIHGIIYSLNIFLLCKVCIVMIIICALLHANAIKPTSSLYGMTALFYE